MNERLCVTQLGATTCYPTSVQCDGWQAEVATYCTTFDAIHPKHDQEEWRSHWADEYGKPMLRPTDGTDRTVAEFEVVKAFRTSGWEANWQDSFGAAPAWMKPWTRVQSSFPAPLSSVLARIRCESPKAKPWDVLAWRGDEFAFVECKAPSEKLTKAEAAFIRGAVQVGVPLGSFAVLRGAIRYPDRGQAHDASR